jgi:hypothetical protein
MRLSREQFREHAKNTTAEVALTAMHEGDIKVTLFMTTVGAVITAHMETALYEDGLMENLDTTIDKISIHFMIALSKVLHEEILTEFTKKGIPIDRLFSIGLTIITGILLTLIDINLEEDIHND